MNAMCIVALIYLGMMYLVAYAGYLDGDPPKDFTNK